MSDNLAHGALGHLYQMTVIDVEEDRPYKMYAASLEGLAIPSLSEVARLVEEQIQEYGVLVGIEDLNAQVMILDTATALGSEQKPGD